MFDENDKEGFAEYLRQEASKQQAARDKERVKKNDVVSTEVSKPALSLRGSETAQVFKDFYTNNYDGGKRKPLVRFADRNVLSSARVEYDKATTEALTSPKKKEIKHEAAQIAEATKTFFTDLSDQVQGKNKVESQGSEPAPALSAWLEHLRQSGDLLHSQAFGVLTNSVNAENFATGGGDFPSKMSLDTQAAYLYHPKRAMSRVYDAIVSGFDKVATSVPFQANKSENQAPVIYGQENVRAYTVGVETMKQLAKHPEVLAQASSQELAFILSIATLYPVAIGVSWLQHPDVVDSCLTVIGHIHELSGKKQSGQLSSDGQITRTKESESLYQRSAALLTFLTEKIRYYWSIQSKIKKRGRAVMKNVGLLTDQLPPNFQQQLSLELKKTPDFINAALTQPITDQLSADQESLSLDDLLLNEDSPKSPDSSPDPAESERIKRLSQ